MGVAHEVGKGGRGGAAAMMTGKLMMRQLQRGEHCHQARQLESDKQARGHEEKREREKDRYVWMEREEKRDR